MATRRVPNRYPRPAERIAPQTLREFLMEPIPRRFRRGAEDAFVQLCDLDESAWQHFAPQALVELSKIVVDRVAAYHVRKVFEHRHFPRPAADTDFDELHLENRTRRCLAREGFEDHPEALGNHTIAEVLAIRAFGPRCLVDLLAALEAQQTGQGRGGGGDLSAELTAAARRLADLPAAAAVRKEDPRFGRLIEGVDVEARTAAELAGRVLARTQDPPDAAYAAGQLAELGRRIEGMTRRTLEQELIDIFASTPDERNRQILIGYHGWEDGRQHTLTEVGRRFGITRERVRQVCAKLTRKPKAPPEFLAPVMDRALAHIEKRLPCPAARLEQELLDEGLTAIGLSLDSVATGALLLGRPRPLKLVRIEQARLAVGPGLVDLAPLIVDLTKKEIYFHGLAKIDKIHDMISEKSPRPLQRPLVVETLQMIDGFTWLDEAGGWFRLLPTAKHGLPKAVDKILAVAGEVTVDQMREALGRNRRLWKEPPPAAVLLEFCRQTAGVRIEGDRIISDPPRDWRKSLTGVEAKLVSVLQEHGPVMERGTMEDLCVLGGMNRFSFHAFVSWSPVIRQLGHSVYGLLGTEVPQQAVEQLVASRRARRTAHRVLDSHGRTDDGKVWLSYRLSKAASTYAVITIPAALKDVVHGRFQLLTPAGRPIGTLATKDGRAWGLGAYLRAQGAKINDHVRLTLDLEDHTATVAWEAKSP